jgi:divalent metal cation (Fe/Co/Zn/Cd) transporter
MRCRLLGALAGLVAVAFGQFWGDPVAGLAVTGSICMSGAAALLSADSGMGQPTASSRAVCNLADHFSSMWPKCQVRMAAT